MLSLPICCLLHSRGGLAAPWENDGQRVGDNYPRGGSDETAIELPRRTNTKGQALFRELAKGEVTIIVIAKDWTTCKATKALAKQHEVVDVLLKPLE